MVDSKHFVEFYFPEEPTDRLGYPIIHQEYARIPYTTSDLFLDCGFLP